MEYLESSVRLKTNFASCFDTRQIDDRINLSHMEIKLVSNQRGQKENSGREKKETRNSIVHHRELLKG